MQCSIDKNALRRQMKEKRKKLSAEERQSKSRAICTAFAALEVFADARVVCVYMSAFGEVDTGYIINECKKLCKEIAVPVVDGEKIYLCRLTDKTEKAAFGIQEPVEKEMLPVNEVDIFAVPALAFDRLGGRVGFGKGYYDRLLSKACGLKVGLIYDFQLAERVPAEAHDILMDYVITEEEVIRCGNQMESLTELPAEGR